MINVPQRWKKTRQIVTNSYFHTLYDTFKMDKNKLHNHRFILSTNPSLRVARNLRYSGI